MFYHLDGLGSVTALSDGIQRLAQTERYLAWGGSNGSQGSVDQPFMFTGREFEKTTGLQYNRARWLDSGLGRWNRKDPALRAVPCRVNLFAYTMKSPTNGIDPSGLYYLRMDPFTCSALPSKQMAAHTAALALADLQYADLTIGYKQCAYDQGATECSRELAQGRFNISAAVFLATPVYHVECVCGPGLCGEVKKDPGGRPVVRLNLDAILSGGCGEAIAMFPLARMIFHEIVEWSLMDVFGQASGRQTPMRGEHAVASEAENWAFHEVISDQESMEEGFETSIISSNY